MKVLGFVLVGLMVASCCSPPKKESTSSDPIPVTTTKEPRPAETQTAKPKPEPAAPALTVEATTLYKDYETNEVAADDKYKDKALLVTGKLQAIDKDFMNNVVLKLTTGDRFGINAVHATLEDSEKSKAAKLSKGDKVSLRCIGGTRIMKSPTLKDCTVQ